jgi:hypothetical protein
LIIVGGPANNDAQIGVAAIPDLGFQVAEGGLLYVEKVQRHHHGGRRKELWSANSAKSLWVGWYLLGSGSANDDERSTSTQEFRHGRTG